MRRRRKEKMRGKGELPAGILFLTGFLLGTVLPNLAWKLEWKQKVMSSVYLLGTVAERRVPGTEYLFYVLQMRGSFLILTILCGFSVFGLPLAVISVLGMGIEIGIVLAMSVLQFGLAGGVVGLGLFLPHYLFYIPVMLRLMVLIYSQSLEMWRNQGVFPAKIAGYSMQAALGILLYSAGILLEVYINPWLMEKILNSMKFF